jgi:hypothetical protein
MHATSVRLGGIPSVEGFEPGAKFMLMIICDATCMTDENPSSQLD